MEFCYKNDTPWGVTKTVSPSGPVASGTAVQFTVQITRGATSSNIICAVGYIYHAFIGNIVVNLQKRVGSRWVSAAADVADATLGDGATSANIVASQSQERANFYNYTVSGQKGTFNETIGSSGTLSFTDADANTLFALTPSFNLAAGATQNLLFEAHFDNTALGIPVGASLRAEILVTFGGAGARGGGNASASNMDVNGDGTPEADVRTVPTRLTKNLPALQACNDSVNV